VYYIGACFTKTVAPVEQSEHIAHSQCDVTKTIRIHRYPKHLFQNREDLFFMKNKTKVVLGLAAMLAGTAGIAGVSTFAWFTTQSTANFTFTDAVVRGDNTYIAVKLASTQNDFNGFSTNAGEANAGVTINNKNDNLLAISGAAVDMIDLSGDGTQFYHPQNYTEPTSQVASGAGSVDVKVPTCTGFTPISANISGTTYFLDVNVSVFNKASNKTSVLVDQISVSPAKTLKKGATVGSTNDADYETLPASTLAATATRVSIIDITDAAKPVLSTMWQSQTGGSYNYLKKDAANASTTYAKKSAPCTVQAIVPDGTGADPVEKVFHAGAYETGKETGNGRVLGDLEKQDSVRTYNIKMWIEGTLDVATNSCIGGHVALNVQFRGKAA
jgi:hypothetical protein